VRARAPISNVLHHIMHDARTNRTRAHAHARAHTHRSRSRPIIYFVRSFANHLFNHLWPSYATFILSLSRSLSLSLPPLSLCSFFVLFLVKFPHFGISHAHARQTPVMQRIGCTRIKVLLKYPVNSFERARITTWDGERARARALARAFVALARYSPARVVCARAGVCARRNATRASRPSCALRAVEGFLISALVNLSLQSVRQRRASCAPLTVSARARALLFSFAPGYRATVPRACMIRRVVHARTRCGMR